MNKQATPRRKRSASAWLPIGINLGLAAWFLSLLDTHFLREIGGSLHSFGSTWGDLPWHLSIIMGFVERGWGSLVQDPVYAGAKLVYPFLPEVLPGLLVKAGFSIRSALIVTTWPFLVLVTSLLTLLAYRITRSMIASALAPLLFCLTGSVVGTYYFLQDASSAGLGILASFWDVGRSYANDFDRGLYFTNAVSDFLLPQRTIVFGLVLGLAALLLLWSYWSRGSRKSLVWAGLCIGLLPLWHTHSFVALCIISGTLFLIDVLQGIGLTKRSVTRNATVTALPLFTFHFSLFTGLRPWIIHFGLLTLLAIPQLLLVLPEESGSFLRWQVGWLAMNRSEASDSWLFFWLQNLGAYFFLIPLAFTVTVRDERKNDGRLPTTDGLYPLRPEGELPIPSRPYPITTFYLGFLAVFLVANLVVFQPWDWDNMKLLLWWFLGSIVLVLHATVRMVRWMRQTRGMIRVPFYLLLVTCSLSLASTGLLSARYESGKSVELFSPADRELADFILDNTPADAVFLTSERHNHPVTALAGRRIYLGYGGWLWSHGIDATERNAKAKRMLDGPSGSMELLHQEGIGYVVKDPSMAQFDTAFFDAQADKLFENEAFALYAIR